MPRVIVVGVDGSEHALHALKWAITEARQRLSSVTALTAWVPLPVPPSSLPLTVTEPYDHHLTEAPYRELLDNAVHEAIGNDHSGLVVHKVIRRMPPAVALTDEAGPEDLLVVGSYGRGRLATALIGSVTVACIQNARCPVTVIPPNFRLTGAS